MELQDAIALITHEAFTLHGKQSWYDLGAGSGVFTVALANLLEAGSKIVAIDNNASTIKQIPPIVDDIEIEKRKQDFLSSEFPYSDFNGILMANSFHYVKNKKEFISKAKAALKPDHSFLFVEYDTERANPWVPYPISFPALKDFFTNEGYGSIIKLHERKSKFNSNKMYSAIILSSANK